MAWILDWSAKDPPGPKKYYLAWKAMDAQLPAADFEYIIHPITPSDGWIYCAAILTAEDRQSAWRRVQRSFENAEVQMVEIADKHHLQSHENVKRVSGVRTIAPKQQSPGAD